MVVKNAIILANSNVNFEIPRQLIPINGEPLIVRTIRLLKENGIKDIIITSHDKRFDNLGATRYEPKYNDYIPYKQGYWLDAFPLEILKEPTIYLFGDVYYSEKAIKTILETPTDDILFFCTYNNTSPYYFKPHDEPLAFKVINIDKFKKHIKMVKNAKDKGLCCREPITWELYRSIHNQDLNKHIMTNGYIAINDESCDIDTIEDIALLKNKIGGKDMIKVIAIRDFTLNDFDKIKIEKRAGKDNEGHLYKDDIFTCDVTMANYLLGNNDSKSVVVRVIEIIPEEAKKTAKPVKEALKEDALTQEEIKYYKNGKKTSKKKK